MRFLLPFFLIIFSFLLPAKKFETSYVSFDLLNNWHCYPEGTEWICTSKLNRKKASEAMIILTAKQKGPMDSLAQYIKYLKSPRPNKTSRGKSFQSKVFHAKQRQINKHMWVDGFHQGSEMPLYYTRYLVTVRDKMAVLVSYSAHKNHYKKYAADFASSINSLRLKNISSGLSLGQRGSMGMGSVQDHLQDMINADDELGDLEGEGGEGEGGGLGGLFSQPEGLVGLGALGAGLTYLWHKRRKKQKQAGGTLAQEGRSSRHRHRRHRRSSSEGRRSSSRSSSRRRRRHRETV